MQRFRGFESETFVFDGPVVLAGEPRAGRSDIVEGLRRVLDPRSTSARINPLDIHRPGPAAGTTELTEVEVSLLDLGPQLSVLLDAYLEPLDAATGSPSTGGNPSTAELGVRLCYRAQYDADSDSGDHWVDAPAQSDPSVEHWVRWRRVEREALPVRFLDNAPPLQVRAEGALRRLLTDTDPDALDLALENMGGDITAATEAFGTTAIVTGGIDSILDSGMARLIGLSDPSEVGFAPEDGTLASLLRTLQPTLTLDAAGRLPLTSQGSTAGRVLQIAEAIAEANRNSDGLVVIADDFGEGLDAAAAEHAALMVRKSASQAILTTRRSEVIAGFAVDHLVRLTRSHGTRQHHRLPAPNKAARFTRTLALDAFTAAITARTLVLTEGPFDVEGYLTLARRLAQQKGSDYSLSANSMRLVSPPGSDGGISRLPAMAELAKELGFHVRAIVDDDGPTSSTNAELAKLLTVADAVVVLPHKTAIEGALVSGLSRKKLREAVDTLVTAGEWVNSPPPANDDELEKFLVANGAIKDQRLHASWARAVTKAPPIATEAIRLACTEDSGRLDVVI